MSTELDLQALLQDIIDGKEPPPLPSPIPAAVVESAQATGTVGDLMMDDPDTLLEGLAQLPTLEEIMGAPTTSVTQVCNKPAQAQPLSSGGAMFDESGPQEALIKMPTFTADDFAETMDIRNFASLATLNTARWHAKVRDRKSARDVGAANDANESAFEVKKSLLAGADSSLKAIHRIIDEARATHYAMTLPWTTTSLEDKGRRTGARLLPNTLFDDYIRRMADCKQRMEKALDEFEPQYPTLIEEAKKQLGKRFDAGEYPNAASIRGHFDMSFDFQPLPKGEDFKGLPQQQLDALARKINNNTRKMAENAMQDIWQRVHTAVAHLAERLSSPDKTFHSSTIENVRQVASMMGHLNITNDPRVELLRQKIEKHLCPHEAKQLRENPVLRTKVAGMAASILQEMQT